MDERPKVHRPTQPVPADLVDRLMAIVRGQFCGDMAGGEWGKHSHFVRLKVILWPAGFVRKKGFTIPAERYESIMRAIFEGIKGNMTNAPIRYWPGYLQKCVQEHWQHHWEDYYREARSAQALTEAGLQTLGKLPARPDGAVDAMAATAAILAHKRQQRRKKPAPQTNLPGF
jgi:hypothetical protein